MAMSLRKFILREFNFDFQRFATINNTTSNTLLSGTSDDDTIKNRGHIILIGAGAGNDSIDNYGDSITVDGGEGDDVIINGRYFEYGGQQVSLFGGAGNDTLISHGSNSVLDGGAGDDVIYNGYRYYEPWNAFYDSDNENYSGNNSTIICGLGNDSIVNYGENVLVLIEGGQNTINGNVTVNMGAGNTTLTGDRSAQIFQYVGGDDVITNYSHEDTIEIAQGKIDSYFFDGGDLIFKVGDGSITLKNMTNHAITVKDSSGKTTTQIYGTGYSGQQVIKNFVQSTIRTVLPDNGMKIDEAIKACSHFNSLEEVVNQMVADCRTAGDADTFLKKYCGIILDNDDSGSPTGWDAGGLAAKTMKDLIPEVGEATYPESTTFIKHGVTITVPEKDSLTEKEQLVIRGFYSWWAEGAFKLIEETYGVSLNGYSVELKFSNEPDKGYWGTGGTVVTVNMAYTQGITETNNVGVDGLFAHELTHFMQAVFGHLGYIYSMYPYMIEGMANLTGGSGGTFASAGNPEQLAKDLALIDNSGNDCYDVGYMFWRYLMKQASDSYDSLKSYAWKDGSVIEGTSAAEFLTGNGSNMMLTAGAGNDTITVYGKKTKVFGNEGDDYILTGANAEELTIDGGEGIDSITVYGKKTKVFGNEGDDYILTSANAKELTIDGGAGNDSVDNYGDSITVDGGIGDDVIINGRYWWNERGGSKVSLLGGLGNDTLTGHGSNSILDGGAGDDVIYNGYHYYEPWNAFYDSDDENYNGNGSTILGGGGNDTIKNRGHIILIRAGAGNDSVDNYGDSITVDGGGDDDIIINGRYWWNERGGSKVSLLGGLGNDTLTSHGSNSILDGGAGDDVIYNGYRYYEPWNAFYDSDDENYNGNGSTILGGGGNDTIKNRGEKVLFKHADNDGFDIIEGFNNTSTLQIGNGKDTYSAIKNDDDVIVTVGKGNITLSGAANLSTVNIAGTDKSTPIWTLSGTTATYCTWNKTLATVSGVKSTNGLSLNGTTVTVSNVALNQGTVSVSSGYNLAFGSDVTKTSTIAAGWNLNGSTATYKNAATNAGYQLVNNQINYVNASDGNTLAMVSGVKSASGLKLSGSTITVSKAALNAKKVTVSDGYKLKLASDVAKTSTKKAWSLSKNTAAYKQTTQAGYNLADNVINYTKAATKTLATVNGVKSTSGLKLSGSTITVSKAALNAKKVTVSNGYKLKLASDVAKTSTKKAWSLSKNTAAYKQTTQAGYNLADNVINYTKAATKTLATVNGVKSTSGLKLSGSTITVSKAALNAKKVTVSNGYKLKLASDVAKTSTKKAWSLSKNTAAYKQTTQAGYNLADNVINYTKAATKTLATVSGVKSTSGLKLSGSTITVSKAALNAKKVTVSNGYKLKLGSNVAKTSTKKAWSLSKNTAAYKQTTQAGYTLADNVINYTKAATKTLATVSGVKSTKGISVSGKVVKLKKISLAAKVTVSGSGYEFDFAAGDYKKTLVTGSKNADIITSRGKNLSISGGAGNDSIKIFGSATTVTGGKGNDSLWGNAGADKFIYESGDGKDVIFGFDDNDTLTFDNIEFTTAYNKKNQTVTFKAGSGSVTLKDFTATTFHINSDVYKISGSKFKKQ